ncbi:MAG TPA: hypothetical protein VKU01_20515 [Bryobacteraceae bacterium]|nr:hypothetical protein [Bryobacteraceae bacterium]
MSGRTTTRTVILLAGLTLVAAAADIPAGTHVLLRMTNSVNTKTARQGDYVYMETASPIAVGGAILVPVHTYVQGQVAEAKPSGRVKGRAEIAIRLDSLTLPGGKNIKINPHLSSVDSNDSAQQAVRDENIVQQGGQKMADAGRIAILAGSGAAIGGLADRNWKGAGIGGAAGAAVGLATVMMTRGHEVDLRQGTTLDVIFDRPVTVE